MDPQPVISSSSSTILESRLTQSNSTPATPTVEQSPIGFSIASVTSIPSDTFANPSETVSGSLSGLMLSDVLSYKDLKKDYMQDDWDKYFTTLSVAPVKPAKPKRKSSVTQPRVELPESRKSSTATTRPDLLQDEIDNAAYILVKGTGLEGRDLYRCSNCDEKSGDVFIFNVHLLNHKNCTTGFKCYHCNVVSKNIIGLKYHIKVHGIHRYFCYYCNYTSAIVNDIQKRKFLPHSAHFPRAV